MPPRGANPSSSRRRKLSAALFIYPVQIYNNFIHDVWGAGLGVRPGCASCSQAAAAGSQARKQQALLVQASCVVLDASPATISSCGAPRSLPHVCFFGHPAPALPQVWGGYDILLAHNTLVRVGCGTPAQDLHRAAIDVLFCERSCGGEVAVCRLAVGMPRLPMHASPFSWPVAPLIHQCSPALGRCVDG